VLLNSISNCLVHIPLRLPTSVSLTPFATLTIHSLRQSLVICLPVAGAAHITSAHDSVLVLSARQIRLHGCTNCTLYLRCSGRPIIEDCTQMRFAPLPAIFVSLFLSFSPSFLFAHVLDFKHSPTRQMVI
jgi:hypothetical protein